MSKISSTPKLILALLSFSISLACANEFLKAPHKMLGDHVSEQDIRTSLLDEVESSLGKGSASNRLSQMEATLRPIFAALPKNEHGRVGHSAVRYALHRLFVLRHGWVIEGLGSEKVSMNSSSPTGVLKDHVPAFIEGLFEQRLAGKGFGLSEVAILAATIEHLIHNEAVGRLGDAFNVHELALSSPITEADAGEVLDAYMMAYILGENLNNMTREDARENTRQMPDVFLAWHDTKKFVDEVRQNTIKDGSTLDFASMAKVVESVGEQYGSFQDLECRQLKDKLVKVEYRGTGRVKLSDFYKPALDGGDSAWTFQESVPYLRSMGILDESDPSQPSVMIANYVTSHANCIASSGYYSVCCKNECEGLLGHLEENIGASEAKPSTIADLISTLPSSTVAAPQQLMPNLRNRLDEIANGHQGVVPLHSRLFAQWMHHVYPRECPYPHVSGTTDSMLPDVFMDESGSDPTATEEEMKQYVAQSTFSADNVDAGDMAVEELMPWSSEQELFVMRSVPGQLSSTWDSESTIPAKMRSLMLFAAAGSLAFGLIQTMKMPFDATTPAKYTV